MTDAQIRTLRRRACDLRPERINCEIAWIRAGKRSSEKVRTEAAMLYTVLRDGLPPPADVLAERARADRLALDHDELARRRAETAATRTPRRSPPPRHGYERGRDEAAGSDCDP